MRISETSHPIGFCGAKITLFAPRRMLAPRFSAPFALRRPKIPCAQSKTPRFGAKTLRFRQKYPYFSLPLGTPKTFHSRARSYIMVISSTDGPYFLVNSFAFSIFFVFLPKSMSLTTPRTVESRASAPVIGRKQSPSTTSHPRKRRDEGLNRLTPHIASQIQSLCEDSFRTFSLWQLQRIPWQP